MSNNNGEGPLKRKPDGCTDVPVSQIKRIGTCGSGDAIVNLPPTPKSVTLEKNSVYVFDSWNVGAFRIQGGFAGNFFVDGSNVTILNLQGNKIFSEGGQRDRVSIVDDVEAGTTIVSLIAGGERMEKNDFPNVSFSNVNISGDTAQTFQQASYESGQIDIANGRANISFGGSTTLEESIPIRSIPNHSIMLRGSRNFVISGYGAILNTVGCGDVTVNGDLQSATQAGIGNLTVHGNVYDSVQQYGTGVMRINGEIKGYINQWGPGNVQVHGNIIGGIYQLGAGNIDVQGSNLGLYSTLGLGTLRFHN